MDEKETEGKYKGPCDDCNTDIIFGEQLLLLLIIATLLWAKDDDTYSGDGGGYSDVMYAPRPHPPRLRLGLLTFIP